MLAQKKLELTSFGAEYSRELFGKVKTDTYRWSEIADFIRTKYKGNSFITIKNPMAKRYNSFIA